MSIDLAMPALSPTMEKGTLAKWLVAVGDAVKPGDLLAEIETDKATMEFEAAEAGRITAILVPDGTEDVAVGTVIARLGDGDGDVATPPAATKAAPAAPPPTPAKPRPSPADRIRVSPLAQRIAEARNIDLSGIAGSGPDGRIVRADLGLSRPAAPRAIAADPDAVAPPPRGVPVETVKLSTMRKTIARRLTESKRTVPHFYLSVRCVLDRLLALRGDLNASLAPRGIRLSVNDLLMKAMAVAMVREPDVNVQFGGGEMHRFGRVDISMAVAVDGGLVTPVIRDVAGLSLSAVAEHGRRLAASARAGALSPEDYQGGTASLSNLGMFGVDEIFPVINPPQAMILGVGSAREMPWKVDGGIALATVMTATASFDHRVIDGATAGRFMAALREVVEDPLHLLA